ncbi:50S ribosomal protein L7/L12 [Mycoplasma sp. 744]|uniref:50S ribosomal protein L7/L12 n=1 Tax=Mycoplasma sp. 744 TaxID=3108531 RepID=UPI002B1CF8DF|nr:50S ribosomal protein L7/L12 [Mycoplasma sp. 744]MEA4115202.1 50S ribosomal protein L7/L12 [Mycoplasma sp. 744]
MAKLEKQTFIEALKEMSIKEVMELVEAMKEEFGIDPSAVAVAAAPAAAEAEEKSSVSVVIVADNGKKLPIVKAVKELLNIPLMDASKLVSALPAVVKENIAPAEAENIKAKLVEAGASVDIK